MDDINLKDPMVSTNWLADHLGRANIRLIDASWRLPGTAQTAAREDYTNRHIPGAVFFDIDEIADKNSDLSHMFPDTETFSAAMISFGISPNDHIIIYDDAGLFSAPRVWWMFRTMGHAKVQILDGGLPKWIDEKRPVTAKISEFPKSTYIANPDYSAILTHYDLRDALKAGVTVLDARPLARFQGQASEPRAGLNSGHMPGATSLPISELITNNKTLKSIEQLRLLFSERGIDASSPAVTTCGAWSEWGDKRNDPLLFPIETIDIP